MHLILGSQSPRRREILSFFNLPFKQMTPDFDEEAVHFRSNPEEYVLTLAKGKGESLKNQYCDPLVVLLTADTIVYQNVKIYGKPNNRDEAFFSLKELSGKWHSVYTGLSVSINGKSFQTFEETRVLFNPLTDDQIKTYQENLSLYDKAGGYMIQGAGSIAIQRIEGCYYNVVGLPINGLYSVLKEGGIDLWTHFKRVKS